MAWPEVDAVAIGASAGGVEALLSLTAALPADFPAAVLVVLHRPQHSAASPSIAEVLARGCRLPLADALDHEPIVAGRVLLAPAGYHLLVDPGPVAALSVDEPVLWSRPAIDPLFESAALVYRDRLLALLLTGASADGSAGALTVRRVGGELWVQDPREAAVPTMPAAALRAAGADRVLGLTEMCRMLGAARARGEPHES